MALALDKKHGVPSAGGHGTVDAVGATKWVRAAFIKDEVHSAEKDLVEMNVKAENDVNGTKRKRTYSQV